MSLAIIVVNKNDSRFLIDLYKRFMDEGCPELIIVDGGSSEISLKNLKKMLPMAKVVRVEESPGPFESFVEGCKIAKSEYVSCWSADDYPMRGYMWRMKDAILQYPFADLFSCNAYVEREGRIYERILLPFDTYISPEYAVKMFKSGFYKQLNLIGSVIKKDRVLSAWEYGGKNLSVNFDGMYFFHAMFDKGLINLGKPLVTFRSYSNGFGATGKYKYLSDALKIHADYYRLTPEVYSKAIASGIWSKKAQWRSQIGLFLIRFIPKFLRLIFYRWYFKYDFRIEKL